MISTSTRTLYLLPGAVQHLALFAFLPQFLVQFRLDVPTNFRVLLTPRLGAIALWKGLGGCAWKGTAVDLETFINFHPSPHWQILAVDSVDVHLSLIFIVWFCQFCRSNSVKGFFGNLVKSPGYLISMQLDKARNILLREKGPVTLWKTTSQRVNEHRKNPPARCWWQSCALQQFQPGWWFGTFVIFPSKIIGKNHPNWLNWLIFFRRFETTKQQQIVFHVCSMWPLWPLAARNGWKPGSLHCSNPTRREVAVSCDDMWWLLMM